MSTKKYQIKKKVNPTDISDTQAARIRRMEAKETCFVVS